MNVCSYTLGTAKGVLGGKARALGSIHARSRFIRCTLASATYTYLVDVFSLPDEVSDRPSSTTNLHFSDLHLKIIPRGGKMSKCDVKRGQESYIACGS